MTPYHEGTAALAFHAASMEKLISLNRLEELLWLGATPFVSQHAVGAIVTLRHRGRNFFERRLHYYVNVVWGLHVSLLSRGI